MVVANEEEEIGEFQAAEYLVFLLALDTYMRYAEETVGEEDAEDKIIQRGLKILVQADRDLEDIQRFLDSHLPTPAHKKMLQRAFQTSSLRAAGATKRAFLIRTLISRGGPATVREVFKGQKYLRAVRESVSASMLENTDKALDMFAAIPMQNGRMRNWIDDAAKQAGSGQAPTPVLRAAEEGTTQTQTLLSNSVQEAAAGSEGVLEAGEFKAFLLQDVEDRATISAKKSLEISQKPDVPLTRSEVVGVATAVATAMASDSSNSQNIPETLRHLDDEQRAAALTDGPTLVVAGAGSGKTATVAARVAYLVKDRRVYPSKILVTSFNNKSSMELRERIGKFVGDDPLKQMSVGTMHSLFKKFVIDYGNTEEKIMMGAKDYPKGNVGDGSSVARTVQKVWMECYGKSRPVPKLKDAKMAASQWASNNVTPTEAKDSASTKEDLDKALWYEMYEGMKGGIRGWQPPCRTKAFDGFMARYRPNNIRLGDYTDMLKVFRDILSRDPAVLARIQQVFDHIIVDEAQDRNTLMRDCLDMLAGQIKDGSQGKSYWVVGDSNQAINSFQGARSELFLELYNKPGWTVRQIKTNYRCEPELVDSANKLISYNEDPVLFEQRPNPAKVHGMGSIRVESAHDEAEAALSVVDTVKSNIQSGSAVVSDHAVLTRTNKELHAYETACIIRGVPYARKGASSFFGSPETMALLGYVQLVTGTDFTKMQAAFANAINKPNRFWITEPGKIGDVVSKAFSDYAYREDVDVRTINPMEALKKPAFLRILAPALASLTKSKKGFKFEEKLADLSMDLQMMKARTSDPDYKTSDLFDEILALQGEAFVDGGFGTQTFRESLQADIRDRAGGEDDDADDDSESEEEGDPTKGLGNISFLYQLAKPDPTDEDDTITPPTTPLGFKAKMERYASRMRDLRTDLNAYAKEQNALPVEKRTPPPGVYLGTVHSTKGAQWNNVAVAMPAGKFPLERPVKPGEEEPDPAVEARRLKDERRLAYVAITRAAKNLTVVCPKQVGGKAAGISSFVYEAGLRLGENVSGKETEERIKQAFDVNEVVWEDGEV